MEFKLNGFEKFIIKHRIAIIRVTGLLSIIGIIISEVMSVSFGALLSFVVLLLIVQLYTAIILKKSKESLALRNKYLQPVKALEATNQLIETTGEKDFQNKAVFLNNRIAFLISLGELEQAENEIHLFWQYFQKKKLTASTNMCIHTNMATIALRKKDFKSYEEQFRIIQDYGNKKLNKRLKRQMQHMVVNLTQYAEATVANENSNFDEYSARVWQTMHFEPVKEKFLTDEQVEPYSYLYAYERFFIFAQNKGDIEKAKTYAQQILNIGNEQFYIYRKAKEYLENENSSN